MKARNMMKKQAYYHLPGLFEFYELYRIFLPLFREHRELHQIVYGVVVELP